MSVFCAKLRIRVALVPVVSEVYPEQKRMAGLAREVLLWAVTARRILSAVVRILRRGWVMRGRGIVSVFDCSRGRGNCVEKIRRGFCCASAKKTHLSRRHRAPKIMDAHCKQRAMARGGVWGDKFPPRRLRVSGACASTLKNTSLTPKKTSLTSYTPLQCLLHHGTRTLS